MKFGILIVFFTLFFLIFTPFSFAQKSFTVGVSPGTINLGKIEKGSTKLVNFYIVTPSEETLLVKLEPEKANLDGMNINNFSEEDITSWVKIINNPIELKPVNKTLKTLGGIIKGQREISFLIEIPKDAEPGKHMVNIKPVPLTPSETIGSVGSRVVAITSVKIILDVIGNVIRKGIILDTEARKYNDNNLELNTYFQNTGTVTISAVGTQKIYDKNGNFIKEIYLGKEYIKPKEIKVFKSFLPTEKLSMDKYNVYTVIDYKTGKAKKSSVIKIAPLPPTTLAPKREENLFLVFLIITIIFIVSAVIYKRI